MIACVKLQTALMAPSAQLLGQQRGAGGELAPWRRGDRAWGQGTCCAAVGSLHAEGSARARLAPPAPPPRWREGHRGRRDGCQGPDEHLPPASLIPALRQHCPSPFPLPSAQLRGADNRHEAAPACGAAAGKGGDAPVPCPAVGEEPQGFLLRSGRRRGRVAGGCSAGVGQAGSRAVPGEA